MYVVMSRRYCQPEEEEEEEEDLNSIWVQILLPHFQPSKIPQGEILRHKMDEMGGENERREGNVGNTVCKRKENKKETMFSTHKRSEEN